MRMEVRNKKKINTSRPAIIIFRNNNDTQNAYYNIYLNSTPDGADIVNRMGIFLRFFFMFCCLLFNNL